MPPVASHRLELSRVARAARRAELRMRWFAALDAAVTTLGCGLVLLAAALTVQKVAPQLAGRWPRDVVVGSLLGTALAAMVAALRRLPALAGAIALDRHHALHGRLANALAFSALTPAQRTPMMELSIEDARAHANALSPRRAVPFAWPRDARALAALAGGATLVAVLGVRRELAPVQAKTIDPVLLSADDLDLFRQVGHALDDKAKSPEVLAALQAYNQLVEDLAAKRLDRTEAFRRMHEIESRLNEAGALDARALDEQLKERASALKKSALSKPIGEALEKHDLVKAEQEMRKLAKRLRESPSELQKAQLEQLREAMKKAAEGQKERMAALDQRREELKQQLLQRKVQQDGGVDDQQQSLLQKKQRELERLDRQRDEQEAAGRRLDRLDRDLAQAAEDIMRQLGLSADDLDQGAEDINRMAQEQMSDEQREQLKQRLEDLREQLRQEGQGGQARMARLRRFARQARGDGQSSQGKQEPCPPGDTACEQKQAQRQQGQGDEEGEGQGQGQSGQTITIGPGGQPILQPSQGQGQAQGQGQGPSGGQPGTEPGSAGAGDGKKGQGAGHDPNIAGSKPTGGKLGTVDVQAAGLDTGQGQSRSEAILGAAQKGFRGGAYKKVYTEYRTSAEEQIHQDKVPPGTNDHIRRYFDLIRPRD